MYRENVITNMEVSDADVVKAANSGFFLERRCCRMTTGLISSQTVCRVGRGFPAEDGRTGRPCDARASRRRGSWTRRRLVTRVANSDRGHGTGVLDAGLSASMITEQEVLTDQQQKGGDARASEQRPRRRRLKGASAGAAAWRARQGADSSKWQPRERRARSQRQTASISREQEHASNDARSQDAE